MQKYYYKIIIYTIKIKIFIYQIYGILTIICIQTYNYNIFFYYNTFILNCNFL